MSHVSHSLVVAAAVLAGLALTTPSQAQGPYRTPQQGSFPYQNPDGTYNSAADYSRSSWGIPCGINCTQSAVQRWQRYYTPNPVPPGP
jgi:hypothetical protein